MSINNLPSDGMISFTTRIRELCSDYKTKLKSLKVGDQVALFKTHSNVPLRRENKNIYLLSAGVGLATFRPLVLNFLNNQENINQVYSLNIDSTREYLFTDIFESDTELNFIADFTYNRKQYYTEVKKLANDKEGIFYIVGSDEFLVHNIELLGENDIHPEQIMIDKREGLREEFFTRLVAK